MRRSAVGDRLGRQAVAVDVFVDAGDAVAIVVVIVVIPDAVVIEVVVLDGQIERLALDEAQRAVLAEIDRAASERRRKAEARLAKARSAILPATANGNRKGAAG